MVRNLPFAAVLPFLSSGFPQSLGFSSVFPVFSFCACEEFVNVALFSAASVFYYLVPACAR